jgi:L-amino acid N-acyltransferase YncA
MKKQACEVLVHTVPTDGELRAVWLFLKRSKGFGVIDPYCRKSAARWVEYMRDPHRKPVVFEVDGQCFGIVWFDGFVSRFKSVQVHYGFGRVHLRYAVAASEFLLRMVLEERFKFIWARVEAGDERSARLATRFGFNAVSISEESGEVLFLLK